MPPRDRQRRKATRYSPLPTSSTVLRVKPVRDPKLPFMTMPSNGRVRWIPVVGVAGGSGLLRTMSESWARQQGVKWRDHAAGALALNVESWSASAHRNGARSSHRKEGLTFTGEDSPMANLMLSVMGAFAQFKCELIVERTKAGLVSARARGRNGGRPFKMTIAKVRLAQAAIGQPGSNVGDLCIELGVSRQTLYRHMDPTGRLRPDGEKLLGRKRKGPAPTATRAQSPA
jgi:hypothetical protein